ncbi:MAG: TetR/AcrR family transcriptional regulator [Alphaproteobacteria bacterium]|nr:TetR/AcrR family transcriptional regulator [Alphaproteobacteria bacterium]
MAKSTSVIICEVATKLFAEKGFNGTSIRNIANKAKVNIASINYHFGNKENLLFEVMRGTHEKFEDLFKSISGEKSLESFTYALYMKFLENHVDLLNTFRILLTQGVQIPQEKSEIFPLLPPGGEIIFDKITEEVGEKVNKSQRYWLTFVLFEHVFLMALFKKLKLTEKNWKGFEKLVGISEKERISQFIKLILKK